MKTLKGALRLLFVLLALVGALPAAQAQIPVTDVASIADDVANQIETIAQWSQQLQSMENQYMQMQSQFNAITGPRGMANLMNSLGVNVNSFLPSDWASVLSTVKSTSAFVTERAKYPTLSSSPAANNLFDVIAAQRATMQQLFSTANARLTQVQQLMTQVDFASDPAAKNDLSNRLTSEQNALQANTQIITTLQANQRQELDAAAQAAMQEWKCKEFKSAGC